jgi:NAD+ synthase
MDWKKPVENIRGQLKYYVTQNGIKSLVLGVSGGIDSALVAALANPVCRELGIPLIGRSLPQASNKDDETRRADDVLKYFCTDYDVSGINARVNLVLQDLEAGYSQKEDEKFNKIALGNIKARIRMIHLYDLAYRNRGMVLSTDNLTELLVGFWTLHGDVGDYGMIQNLWKSEVYDLSKWLCVHDTFELNYGPIMDCVEAVPTDGLGITNSDLDQLGAATYEEVDNILKTWLTNDQDSFYWDKDSLGYSGRLENYEEFAKYRESLKDHPVIQRHLKSEFKRKNPVNIQRTQIFKV